MARESSEAVLVEELLLKHGLDVIEQLQRKKIPRSVKNRLLHFTSYVLTLHQLIDRSPAFQNQLSILMNDAIGFADQFNAYDSVILFKMLR